MNKWEIIKDFKKNVIIEKKDIKKNIKKDIKKNIIIHSIEKDIQSFDSILSKMITLLPNENKYFLIRVLQINNFDLTTSLAWILTNRFQAYKIRRQMASMDRHYHRTLVKKKIKKNINYIKTKLFGN